MSNYFVCDTMKEDVTIFNNEEERDTFAKTCIEAYQKIAISEGEWPDEVNYIYCGIITHRSERKVIMKRPKNMRRNIDNEGRYWPPKVDEFVKYEIEKIENVPKSYSPMNYKMVLICDSWHVCKNCVIIDDNIYKMWYNGNDHIDYAISKDGITWNKQKLSLNLDEDKKNINDIREPYVIKEVINNKSIYKMWYSVYYKHKICIGYAISDNGVEWTKHGMVLDIGNPDNGDWDSYSSYAPCVIKDNNTYKMWYTGNYNNTDCIGYAVSDNGINWNKKGIVLGLGNIDNRDWDCYNVYDSHVIKDVINNKPIYKMWYSGYGGDNVNIGYATSEDGIKWTKHGIVLDVDRDKENTNDVYAPCVIIDNNIYKMWYSINDGTNFRIGYTELNKKGQL